MSAQADASGSTTTATAAAQYPPWVTSIKEQGKGQFTDKSQKAHNLQLFAFSFLGKPFDSGVNYELVQRLVKLQKKLYDLAKQSLGIPEPTEKEFADWIWEGQNPDQSSLRDPKGKAIQNHVGFRPRAAFHGSGSAVDINLFFNPFVPLRTGNVYGGEEHKVPDSLVFRKARAKDASLPSSDAELRSLLDTPKPKDPAGAAAWLKEVAPKKVSVRAATNEVLTALVWKPAVEVYDRAYSFMFGTKADVHDDPDPAHIEVTVRRFQRVHYAVISYFLYGFWGNGSGRPFDNFLQNFEPDFDNQGLHPKALAPNGKLLLDEMTASRTATLRAIYDQIRADRDVIRLGMVNGKVLIADDGKDGTAEVQRGEQRHPNYGFLNLRGELVIEAVRTSGLRWGGAMFGIGPMGSGDMMHFDLNAHILDGSE